MGRENFVAFLFPAAVVQCAHKETKRRNRDVIFGISPLQYLQKG